MLLNEADLESHKQLEASLTLFEKKETNDWQDKIKKQETFAHKTTVDVANFEVEENIDEMV